MTRIWEMIIIIEISAAVLAEKIIISVLSRYILVIKFVYLSVRKEKKGKKITHIKKGNRIVKKNTNFNNIYDTLDNPKQPYE